MNTPRVDFTLTPPAQFPPGTEPAGFLVKIIDVASGAVVMQKEVAADALVAEFGEVQPGKYVAEVGRVDSAGRLLGDAVRSNEATLEAPQPVMIALVDSVALSIVP